jgi:transposase
MRQKLGTEKPTAGSIVKDIRRRTRQHLSAVKKICVVLKALHGEDSIAAPCLREGIATSLYCS